MVSQGCIRCDGSQVVGVGVGVGEGEGVGVGEGAGGWMAAAVGEEACSEESRGERGLHWLKETSYSL